MIKKYSSDREKLLKFEVEGQEFAKLLWSLLEQFIQTTKGQNNLRDIMFFYQFPRGFSDIINCQYKKWNWKKKNNFETCCKS